jgi:hypothetical protein
VVINWSSLSLEFESFAMTLPPSTSLFGWTRSTTPVHGHEVLALELPGEGPIQLARWLHPEARRAPETVEPARVAAMRAHLRPGDVAVVIGAAAGAEALELGLAVGREGAVIALEGERWLFPVLAANAALNRDRVRIFPHLLAVAREGPATAFGVPTHPLEPFLSARHAGQLDRLRWLSFRFGDQGPLLLEALRPLVTSRRPLLRILVGRTARKAQRQALLALLDELRYRVERFAPTGTTAADPLTPANLLRGKQLDLLALPDPARDA